MSTEGYSGYDFKKFLLLAELEPDEVREIDVEAPHFKNGGIKVWLPVLRTYFERLCDSVDIGMRNQYHTSIMRDANGRCVAGRSSLSR